MRRQPGSGTNGELSVADTMRQLAFKVAQGVRQLHATTQRREFGSGVRQCTAAVWLDLREAHASLTEFLDRYASCDEPPNSDEPPGPDEGAAPKTGGWRSPMRRQG